MFLQVEPLTWKQVISYGLVASFAAILSSLVTFTLALLNRGKSKAEIRNLDANTAATAGDVMLKALRRLDDAEDNAHEVREELEEWKRKARDRDALQAANVLLETQLAEASVQAKYWEGEARKTR